MAAPELVDISITQVLDVSSGSTDLTLMATATDDDEIARVVFYFDRDLSYSFGAGSNGSIRNGWAGSDTASSTYEVTDSSLNGTINVQQVWVYDMNGNVVRYDQLELQSMGLDTDFEIIGGLDEDTPPELVDISITQVLDVSSGSTDLTLMATATDDDEIARVVFYFDRDLSYSFGAGSNGSIRNGWAGSDTASSTYEVTDSSLNGTINVQQVWVYDMNGNVVRYDQLELQSMGLDTDFEIIGGHIGEPSIADLQIVGAAEQGATLEADISALKGDYGLDSFTYQWLRDGALIMGATSKTYELTQKDVGADIAVRVAYKVDFGALKTLTSATTEPVVGDLIIVGNAKGNEFSGGAFNDHLSGRGGDDTLKGYGGEDILVGGKGADTAFGGPGFDTLKGGSGNDRLIGQGGGDRLVGAGGHDILLGGAGNDVLLGGGKNDSLVGRGGADELDGGAGADELLGGGGKDTLFGGGGKDRIQGQKGTDVLAGGRGRDTFFFNRGDGLDTITDFELGIDHIEIGRGASRFGQLDFAKVGDDVIVSFRNVEITIKDTTVDELAVTDHFLFF